MAGNTSAPVGSGLDGGDLPAHKIPRWPGTGSPVLATDGHDPLEATVYRPATATTLARADLEAVHNAVFMIDQLMSLYRPESELVALNAQAGAGQIEVSAATGKGWMIAALLWTTYA